ncbi:hypothetical protein ACFSTH_11915 [Paenibacillus yanchengensis]|uniref:Copper amine oxidase-like N-terminal domain-containing protein n=1 Tax=Paenibacillus yanchengensis TaxID=2035833 RepID=A0ABW4YPF9_9BACL
MKKSLLWLVILLLCLPLGSVAAAPAKAAKEVKTEEIGVFIDGNYVVSPVKALKIGSKNYLPLKIISKLSNIDVQVVDGKTVLTGTKDLIVIEKDKAEIFNVKKPIQLEKIGAYAYVAISDLSKITDLGVKTLTNSGSVLLWTTPEGKQKTDVMVSGIAQSKDKILKENFGKKMYFYGSSKSYDYGWIVGITSNQYNTESATYLLKNGKLIEDYNYSYQPMISEKEYKELQAYVGKTVWAYRNSAVLANSSIKNIEKLKIASIVLNSDSNTGMTIKFKRADGSTVNQRIPLRTDKVVDYYIADSFFLDDPHKTYKVSKKFWSSIYKRAVMKGMTKEQAVLAWGAPERVNEYGNYEQWVYSTRQYLYFEKNSLYSWQNF